jgi:hypothetical protein
METYVKNDSGVDLPKGTVVYFYGADGSNVLVRKAQANSDATSSQVAGFTSTAIPTNGKGYIITQGFLTGLDTSAATVGDPIYLSGSTAGAVLYGLANKPYAPTHLVYLGVVNKANPSTGEIYVKVQNGYELDELHNVSATSPTNLDAVVYDSASQLWKNTPIVNSLSAGTGISVSATRGAITATNTGVVSLSAGTGVSVSGTTGGITLTNTGVVSMTAGSGISISATTGSITISNTSAISSLTATAPIVYSAGNISANATSASTANYLVQRDGSGNFSATTFSGALAATNVTGVLGVANGGTATSGTPASGQMLIGNGTNYTLANPFSYSMKIWGSSSVAQSITSTTASVYTTITFDTAAWTNTSMWTSGNAITAPVAGYYLVTAVAGLAPNGTGTRYLLLSQNSSAIALNQIDGLGTGNTTLTITTMVKAAAGDTFVIGLRQDSGSSLAVYKTAVYTSSLSVTFQGYA